MATTFEQVYADFIEKKNKTAEARRHAATSSSLKGGNSVLDIVDPTSRISAAGEASDVAIVKELQKKIQDAEKRVQQAEADRAAVELRFDEKVAEKVAEQVAEKVADVETQVLSGIESQLEALVQNMANKLDAAQQTVEDANRRLVAGGKLEHVTSRVLSVAPNAESNARAAMEGMRVTLNALSENKDGGESLQALHDLWLRLQAEHDRQTKTTTTTTRAKASSQKKQSAFMEGGAEAAKKQQTPIVGIVPIVTQLVEEHDAARRTGDRKRAAVARATFEEHLWKAMGVRYELPRFSWE